MEIARLGHTMHVLAVAWMEHDSGVVTLGDNGIVSTWTRNVSITFPSFSSVSVLTISNRCRTSGSGQRS